MDIDLLHQHLTAGRLSKADTGSGDIRREAALKEACQGFEAIFLNTLIRSMRDTLPENTFLDSGHGQKIYQSMYDQYLSEKISKGKNSIGIKELLFDRLKDSL